MKKSLGHATLVAGTAIVLFACQKVDSIKDPELTNKVKHKSSNCLITSFGYSNNHIPDQTIFTNHYNGSLQSLEVDAGVFSGGSVVSSLPLSVKWTRDAIAFIRSGSAGDTVLIASLDKKGRVQNIVPGNSPDAEFLPTSFDYNKDQISAIHIELAGNTVTSYFAYDNKGNCTSITDAPLAGVNIPGKIEYEYAANEKAKQQFYMDEPRKFSWNSFTLLQYIGFFPELQPVNLRTSTKVIWGNNYQAYYMKIANQKIDPQGKLMSYDIVHPQTGQTVSHYNINWTCANGNNNAQNQQGNN